MKILLANDDGYRAGGIHALAEIMTEFGDICVAAPKYHQSAMSTAVSLGLKKLAFKEIYGQGPGRWCYLDATPASCVKFGLEYFYENRDPDLVVCGINHGSNAGAAANYSATLGAAEEGAINGCRSVGVSVCDFRPDADFSAVKAMLPGILKTLLENWPDRYGLYYNINFPGIPADEIKGIRATRLGRCHWVREFIPWEEMKRLQMQKGTINDPFFWQSSDTPLEEGETAWSMVGELINDELNPDEADHTLNDAGYVTITPLTADYTDYKELLRIRKFF